MTMQNNIIGIAAVVSVIISTLTTLIVRMLEAFVQSRIDERKTMLNYKSQVSYEYAKRKMESYPNMATLIYRFRNSAREIVEGADLGDKGTTVEDAIAISKAYDAELCKNRTLLESDGLFLALHEYKADVTTFVRALHGIMKQIRVKNSDGIEYHKQLLRKIYGGIDEKYSRLMSKITGAEEKLKRL